MGLISIAIGDVVGGKCEYENLLVIPIMKQCI